MRREPGQQCPQPAEFAVGVGAVYAITDLEPHQARPDELAAWIRVHWQIEVRHEVALCEWR